MRIVPSGSPIVAKHRPSALQAANVPCSRISSWPVAGSQTLTVPSVVADASRLPSGLQATTVDCCRMAGQNSGFKAGRDVPYSNALVTRTRSHLLSIRAPGDRVDRIVGPGAAKRQDFLACRRIPDEYLGILRRRDSRPIWTPGKRVHGAWTPAARSLPVQILRYRGRSRENLLPADHVPDLNRRPVRHS